MKAYLNSLDSESRRHFMLKAAKTLLGVSLLPVAGSVAHAANGGGKAKSLIYLYMGGGMSHIDTFDPKTDSEVKGPTTPINTKADFQLSNFMPKLADQADKITLIRSMNTRTGVHEDGTYVMLTGYSPRGTIVHPTIGPWAQKLLGRKNKGLPDSVDIMMGSPGAGFMEPSSSPVPIQNPEGGLQNAKLIVEQTHFDRRLKLSNEFDSAFREKFQHKDVKAYNEFYDETLSLLKSEDLKVFDLKEESDATRNLYGRNGFGQGCLLARRLVEKNVRVIQVGLGGWDMHNQIGGAMTNRAQVLDTALAALISDLSSRGLLDSTMVVVGSEFGRTPSINSNAGRDHHPRVFSTLFAGGGVKGGFVYGASDKKAFEVADKQVSVQDFMATIGYGLGLPLDKTVFSPSGRPFTMGDKGKPVTEIFA